MILAVICVYVFLVAHLCPTLCDPMDCSPPGFSVHGISQQECWSGLPFASPGDLPNPRIVESPLSSALQADSLPAEPMEVGLIKNAKTTG